MKLRVLLGSLIIVACAQTEISALTREQVGALGREAAKVLEYSPKPDYPLEARAALFTGSGVFIVIVHPKTGRVAEVLIDRSTGHAILDQAAVRAFSQWRFKPGGLKHLAEMAPWQHNRIAKIIQKGDVPLKIPCNFTLRRT
jgi:TonB family protein